MKLYEFFGFPAYIKVTFILCNGIEVKWSESHSVMSDSWRFRGNLQARILEWVPFPFSKGSWSASCSIVPNSLWLHGLYSPWNSPGQNTRVGSLSLLQGIFPTQGWNPSLPHCSQILYQLSHKRSPRLLEWVAYPFSSRSSQLRNRTRVSCIAGGLFTNWAIREV